MNRNEPTAGEWKSSGLGVMAPYHGAALSLGRAVYSELVPYSEACANASLFAASKDLLAACEAALEYAEHGRCDFDYVTRLRDAIAKAKGET